MAKDGNKGANDNQGNPKTPEGNRLITRAEVARILGVSGSSVRRMEGRELHPIIVDEVHFHNEMEVRELLMSRSGAQPAAVLTYDAELAAKVFGLLDEGLDSVAIVKKLVIHPEVVEQIEKKWIIMRSLVVLSSQDLDELYAIPGFRAGEIFSSEDLLACVKFSLLSIHRLCGRCKARAAATCTICEGIRVQEAEIAARKTTVDAIAKDTEKKAAGAG